MKSSKKSDDMVVQRYEIVRTTTRREQRRGSYGTADSSNSRSLQSLTEKAATWTRNSNLNHLNNSAEHTHSHTQSTRGIGPSPKADVSVNQRVKQGSWHHTKRAPARKTKHFLLANFISVLWNQKSSLFEFGAICCSSHKVDARDYLNIRERLIVARYHWASAPTLIYGLKDQHGDDV